MPIVEKKLDEFFTAENAESAEKRFTTEGHPPASPERLAMAGRRIYTEKILARITKTRRHEKHQTAKDT